MNFAKVFKAAVLGVLSVLLMNSCYYRSLVTDPFRDDQKKTSIEREIDEKLLNALNDKLKDAKTDEERLQIANQIHAQTVRGRYPSAQECRKCHQNHYREWSASPHAYAQLSPVFNAMQGTVNKLTSGTNGDFCIRCHTPVGMNLGEKTFMSNLDRHPTSREGITCIVCHRVNQQYGKISGRFGLVTGDIHEPIYGPTGNAGVKQVVEKPNTFAVKTDRNSGRGQSMHSQAQRFFQLTNPAFCGMCHDVNNPNGFRLEEAFSEYKASPAAKEGTSCQDCHMGKEPGLAEGYNHGPAAIINGVKTRDRRLSNHMFVGPDYSVVHPGIYPHNPRAVKHSFNQSCLATMEEWLKFDHEAGWGMAEFENKVEQNPDAFKFPARWSTRMQREKARDILNDQQKLLAEQAAARKKLLQRGYRLGEIEAEKSGDTVAMKVEVYNGTNGHNVPTGFTAERIVFLRVTATTESGEVIYQSGDLDPNGDLRDSHSQYVHNGELPIDKDLFSLQSKFILRNERGSEREQILAVNYSQNPLAFVRPDSTSTVLTGRPAGARIHKFNIPPNGRRYANYSISIPPQFASENVTIKVQLIAGMVPVNLVGAIQHVGFDYGMSARQVADRIVAGHQVLWEKTLNFN